MIPIGLLIEFKDGRIKEANFGLATAAHGENRQLVALVVDAPAEDAQKALAAFGVARIVNISTGSRLGPGHSGRRRGRGHGAI
jgi:hypothetical protein